MAADKIPEPNDDAYDKGFLNKDYASKAVKRINRKIRVVANGYLDAAVKESEENVMIDLSMMIYPPMKTYIIANGALVPALITMKTVVSH